MDWMILPPCWLLRLREYCKKYKVQFRDRGRYKVRFRHRASWKDNAQDGFQPGDFIHPQLVCIVPVGIKGGLGVVEEKIRKDEIERLVGLETKLAIRGMHCMQFRE